MHSSVLHSKRAVEVNIQILRSFVRLRQLLASHASLARKLAELEGNMTRDSRSCSRRSPFGRHSYLVTAVPYGNGYSPNFSVPVGCAADVTPPTFPLNFLAYNITGTTASVSWSPASDAAADLAYYAVYRNNALVGNTDTEYFNDSGLPLSSTNNYMIQPVNAWQLQNTGCTSSIYVKTNATLTLMMNKATTADAGLNWTDAGFNNYNIFRGNDPRVMSQIGATPTLNSTDLNALADTLSYFYSVDNPGP